MKSPYFCKFINRQSLWAESLQRSTYLEIQYYLQLVLIDIENPNVSLFVKRDCEVNVHVL